MRKIKELINKDKKIVLLILSVLLVLVVFFYFFSLSDRIPLIPGPVVVNNSVPPVVTNAPELLLVKVNPLSGNRESLDTFSQTFFEFSVDLNESSAHVTVTPYVSVSTKVYKTEPRVLVIEPLRVPWADGVEYTIIIKKLWGINGEELKKSIEYKFSNIQPKEFIGGDPAPKTQ